MTYKKHLYSAFAQTVFGKNKEIFKMTALDFDIILYLIFNCSFEYETNHVLSHTVLYTELKDILPSTPNTDSIKKSLLKIHELEIKDNLLKSYGDKEPTVHIPFDIKILKDDYGKSHGFQVTADETFMKLFTNPVPMIKLNYQNISNLTTYASKKLYILLKDALGIHKSQPRTIDIREFEYLLNMPSQNTTKSQVVAKVKEAIKLINKNTDIKVSAKNIYKLQLNGKKELDKIKFEITKQKLKSPPKTKSDKDSQSTDTVEEVETVDISKDKAFIKFVENKVQEQVNTRRNLTNPKAWAAKTKTILLKDDETITEFNLIKFLEEQKDSLRESIPNDGYQHMIVLGNEDNMLTKYWVNSEYLIVDRNDSKIKTENVYETLDFIQNEMMNFNAWEVVLCDNIVKYNLVAF